MRQFRWLLVLLVGVAASVVPSVALAAGPYWAVTPTPSGPPPQGVLPGVSCTSLVTCFAVGNSANSVGPQTTLIVQSIGTSWSVQKSANPTGAKQSTLSGVSCTAAPSIGCIAVGNYLSGSGNQLTLAEELYATQGGLIQATPNPPGAQRSVLSAVACPTLSSCVAAGYYVNNSGTEATLAEQWDGTSWTLEPPPNPTGAGNTVFVGVSCSAPGACTAVGYYYRGSTRFTLAERWNGTSWAIQGTPNPTGAIDSVLKGASCTTATACTAVGYFVNSGGTQSTLAERWNGTTWTIEPTPEPTGAGNSVLSGVSCVIATACTAVGYSYSSGISLTLAERWNGTSWTLQSTPSPAGAGRSVLSGVYCRTTTGCTTSGSYTDSSGSQLTLAEVWSGTSWTMQSSPSPKISVLSGLSCTTATACIAVGDYVNSAGFDLTMAEEWDGTSWTIQPTVSPNGAGNNVLSGVSCTTATACIAVGDYVNGAHAQVPLAEQWDGSEWSAETLPSPAGAKRVVLSAVSCTSSTACTAIGSYYAGSTQVTLAEQWNGTSWAIQTTPSPAGSPHSVLSSIACQGSSDCTAVGWYLTSGGTQAPLAEQWDGTAWSIEATPNPNAGANNVLSVVSCAVATACTAVGYYHNGVGATQLNLAEGWDGTSWTIEPTLDPPRTERDALYSVSCPLQAPCTSLGYYSSGFEQPLAEQWSGTIWTDIVPPASRAGWSVAALPGLWCASQFSCIAIGDQFNSYVTQPLAERYF